MYAFFLEKLRQIVKILTLLKIYIKKIVWWRFFLIIIPPLFFAYPVQNLLYEFSFSLEQGSIEKIQEIPYTEVQSWGKTFFSKISGIETFPMPVFFCVKNNIKFTSGGKDVTKELVNAENAGDISINIKYPDNSEMENMKIKRGEKSCSKRELISGTSFINPINLETPIPMKKPAIQSDSGKTIIIFEQIPDLKSDLWQIEPSLKLKFPNINYFKNVFIFLIAWGFILILFRDLKNFVIKENFY